MKRLGNLIPKRLGRLSTFKKVILGLVILAVAVYAGAVVEYNINDGQKTISTDNVSSGAAIKNDNSKKHSNSTAQKEPSQQNTTGSQSNNTEADDAPRSNTQAQNLPSVAQQGAEIQRQICENFYQGMTSSYNSAVEDAAAGLTSNENEDFQETREPGYDYSVATALHLINYAISETNTTLQKDWNSSFGTANIRGDGCNYDNPNVTPLRQVPACKATYLEDLLNCEDQIYPSLGLT